MRPFFLHKFCIAAYALLVASLVNLQIINGGRYRELSRKNCIRLIAQSGSRGKVLDRAGNVIAGNHATYDVVILPQEMHEIEGPLSALAGILGEDLAELRKRFRRNYVAPSIPVTLAEDVGLKTASAIEEKRFDLDGVIIQTNSVRDYPHGSLACHVLGYISEIDRWRLTRLEDYGYKTRDLVGFGGVEERYDYYLRQEDGGLSVEVDHRGRFVRTLGYKPGEQGRDLRLTLDLRVQKIVEQSFESRGCVVLMDVKTGAVAALASKPGFSPEYFAKKRRREAAQLFSSPAAPMVNRAISGVYPPGSVFKLLVACAALETNRIGSATSFNCSGSAQIGKRQFQCWDAHGAQELTGAIARSCDVFFYRTGLRTGAQAIHDYAVKLGFTRPTGIEIPYESSGFVPDPRWRRHSQFRQWFDGDTANLSIGQGELLVSPLQVCRLTAVFANGGKLVTPFIIKAIDNTDVSLRHMRITDLHLKDRTVQEIRKGMRRAVKEGTCSVLASLPVTSAGKTGTAQISGREADNHAWFTGFFPYEEPKYAICVFLERGGHGVSAALVARRIIEQMCQEGLLLE